MRPKTKQDVWRAVLESIGELFDLDGREVGEVQPATMLGQELGITSVDAIHLLVSLEDRFDQPLSFQELAVRDGEYVTDLTADELVNFICGRLRIAA